MNLKINSLISWLLLICWWTKKVMKKNNNEMFRVKYHSKFVQILLQSFKISNPTTKAQVKRWENSFFSARSNIIQVLDKYLYWMITPLLDRNSCSSQLINSDYFSPTRLGCTNIVKHKKQSTTFNLHILRKMEKVVSPRMRVEIYYSLRKAETNRIAQAAVSPLLSSSWKTKLNFITSQCSSHSSFEIERQFTMCRRWCGVWKEGSATFDQQNQSILGNYGHMGIFSLFFGWKTLAYSPTVQHSPH